MERWTRRTEALFDGLLGPGEGERVLNLLAGKRVAVVGLGGVGSACAEALCRCGVGRLLLVDSDAVKESNLNRQLIASRPALGLPKAEALRERLLSINPDGGFEVLTQFILPENLAPLFDPAPDAIADCIDTVTAKLALAEGCAQRGIPLVSSMGTGGRLDPTLLRTGDIADTAGCGCALSRVMRRELKKRGVERLDVVYSLEPPVRLTIAKEGENGRHPPTSSPFVPPAAGFALASLVVRRLSGAALRQ